MVPTQQEYADPSNWLRKKEKKTLDADKQRETYAHTCVSGCELARKHDTQNETTHKVDRGAAGAVKLHRYSLSFHPPKNQSSWLEIGPIKAGKIRTAPTPEPPVKQHSSQSKKPPALFRQC